MNIWNVIALGIGSMIGAGIFALLGQVTLAAGSDVTLALLSACTVALFSGYSYARLAVRYPSAGGMAHCGRLYLNAAYLAVIYVQPLEQPAFCSGDDHRAACLCCGA